jgi:hypothetical protein
MYRVFQKNISIDRVATWKSIASKFDELAGYTSFGDLIVQNSSNRQFGMIFTTNPELVSLDYYDKMSFVTKYLGTS